MIRIVGLSRPIRLEWLNKTIELVKEDKTEDEIRDELNRYLSFEIKSPTNLRKSREILMNIWVKVPDELQKIKNLGINLYKDENINKLVIHWCMMLLAYPVFSDTCSLIGKITNVQGTFTTNWLKQNLMDLWGERATLLHSVDKILQTLKYTGSIENVKRGQYKINIYEIFDKQLKILIVMTIMELKSRAYYEIFELSNIPQMFPFKYDISYEILNNSGLFTLNNFGGKIVLVAE